MYAFARAGGRYAPPPAPDKIGLIVHKYNLVITNKAALKESCVVKSVALDNESSWVARVAQGHQHLKMMTMMIQL